MPNPALDRLVLTLGFAASMLATPACRAPQLLEQQAERAAIELMLTELYACFDFDAGGQADWDGMQALFADGASFVAPRSSSTLPRAVSAQEFLRDFRAWIADTDVGRTGRFERIVRTRVDVFGNIAHAYVTFEGYPPPDGATVTRGIDSIQLVRHDDRWLVASFTTQYASESAPIPARFDD